MTSSAFRYAKTSAQRSAHRSKFRTFQICNSEIVFLRWEGISRVVGILHILVAHRTFQVQGLSEFKGLELFDLYAGYAQKRYAQDCESRRHTNRGHRRQAHERHTSIMRRRALTVNPACTVSDSFAHTFFAQHISNVRIHTCQRRKQEPRGQQRRQGARLPWSSCASFKRGLLRSTYVSRCFRSYSSRSYPDNFITGATVNLVTRSRPSAVTFNSNEFRHPNSKGGGQVAALIFAHVAAGAMRLRQVSPKTRFSR